MDRSAVDRDHVADQHYPQAEGVTTQINSLA